MSRNFKNRLKLILMKAMHLKTNHTLKNFWKIPGDNEGVKILEDKINDFFISITENFSPLSFSCSTQHVPIEFLISEAEVYRLLSSLQVNKSIRRDKILNRVLNKFVAELLVVIKDIYNQSIKEGSISEPLKSSIISPIPKVTPSQ